MSYTINLKSEYYFKKHLTEINYQMCAKFSCFQHIIRLLNSHLKYVYINKIKSLLKYKT